MENQEKKHTRRVRYKGTHPKTYKEKYKELQPEKYINTIEKIRQKGNTPAGMHISICIQEILDILQIKPGETGLDATLGYGGHTLEMLKCLQSEGHMYAIDADPIELDKTRTRLTGLGYGPEILTIQQLNFSDIDRVTTQKRAFDFVLADLGVSSMQLDNPDRGFSYKTDGPLDLRLNPEKGITAAQRLQRIKQEELEGMLIENADEPYAAEISQAIISEIRKGTDISTTADLRKIIENTLSCISGISADKKKDMIKKSCQRTFQALRIDINNEFEVLYNFLEKLPDVLSENGRVAVLTFHSGEDRLVKKSFKRLLQSGVYSDIAREVIRPSEEECRMNSRAKSAKLRWAKSGRS